MKKLLIVITVLATVLITAVSCDFTGLGGTPQDTEGYKRIVVAEANVEILDIAAVRTAIFNLDEDIDVVTDAEGAVDGEIVFGNADRAITQKAKQKLQSEITKTAAEVGYIIYAEGKNVAVYWSFDDMKSAAISAFLKTCVEEAELELADGVVASRCFTEREFIKEAEWLALAEVADPDVYNALRELSEYYDGSKILGWIANLWDNDIGGFYYSASARNNEPFLPDIESTNQVLGWLTNNNVMKDQNDLPNDIKMKLVNFAKSLQYPDGYFYHPQWPIGTDKLNVDRYGRDLSWAGGIITRFTVDTDNDGVEERQYPNWCTPSGIKCKLHDGTADSCSYASATLAAGSSGISAPAYAASRGITAGLGGSVSAAVSRVQAKGQVVAVASVKPDYSSPEAFIEWLEATNTDIKKNSGNAQMINAQQDVIIAKGYCDELLDFLDNVQEEIYEEQAANNQTPSGLWQYDADYHAVWGLLKYTPFYNDGTYGREIKYAKEIVETCLRVIMLPADGRFQANDIYNQWQGMQALLNNVKKYNSKGLEELYATVRENAADYITNSIAKLEYFKSPEGAFAFNSTGRSSTSLYGTPVSKGELEGDVNATVLLCSMYRCMFSCLGYDVIHLCNEGDAEVFIETIRNLDPIVKNEMEPAKTMDFEDDEAFMNVGKLENLSGSASANLIEYSYEIPGLVGIESGNHVVKYNTASSPASYGDGLTFALTGLTGDNCIIIESDICVVSNANNNDMLQIRIGDFYRLRLNKSGNNIRLIEMIEITGAVSAQTITTSLKMGEWFRLRVECYKTDEENDTPYFKIFINGEYVTTTSGAYGINSADLYEGAATVLFRSYKTAENEILFDNCFFHVEQKIYDPDDHTISDSRDDV